MTYSQIQVLCGDLDRQEISRPVFVEQCTQLIGTTIGCSRAGIWLFDYTAEGSVLRCLGIHDRLQLRTVLAPDEVTKNVGPYFQALKNDGHVIANDVSTHPATRGFLSNQLGLTGIRSLLATGFSINGSLFGAFTCTEMKMPLPWTTLQLTVLKRISGRVSLALAGAIATEYDDTNATLVGDHRDVFLQRGRFLSGHS